MRTRICGRIMFGVGIITGTLSGLNTGLTEVFLAALSISGLIFGSFLIESKEDDKKQTKKI